MVADQPAYASCETAKRSWGVKTQSWRNKNEAGLWNEGKELLPGSLVLSN